MRRLGSFGIAVLCTVVSSAPAIAQGVITITQNKALAGGVTPGDDPGFPITITQSGSYRFASDILVNARKVGIGIEAGDVLIDMNGFRLHGLDTGTHGISGDRINTTVRNGTIRDFKFDGIRQTHFGWVVENMRIQFNGGHGINGGDNLRVKDSLIHLNGGSGVTTAFNDLTVRNSSINGNQGDGIACGFHCHIEGNLIHRNEGRGVVGGVITVLGNTISANTGLGIEGGGGYGNNTLDGNNGGSGNDQVSASMDQLHPNVCDNGPC